MTPGDPTSHARDALERAVDLCRDAIDEVFLLDLARVVGLVQSNLLLARCADDAGREADRLLAAIAQGDVAVRAELVELRRELSSKHPAADDYRSDGPFEGKANPSYLAIFDRFASGQRDPGITADRWADDSVTSELLSILGEVVGEVVPRGGGDKHSLRTRVRLLQQRRQVLHRDQMNVERRHAGAIWTRLREVPAHVNPANLLAEGVAARHLGGLFPIVMYGHSEIVKDPSEATLRKLKKARMHLEADLKLLEDEILTRLGARVSREWGLRRYAERCARLRPEELRALVASGRSARRKEKLLTADAAAYLFDQGLDVWTEVSIGSSRPDLVHLRPGPGAFVVEAKVHNSLAAARHALRQGLPQLHNYVTRLQPMAPGIDGSLLVFRLGGPVVVLPPEVSFAGCTLRLVSIDIGAAGDSGRRAPPPVVLSAAEILDEPGATKRQGSEPRRAARRRRR